MLVIGSSRARALVGAAWLTFAVVNVVLMFVLPGEETIPYHLVWVSFTLLYGLARWSITTTVVTFTGITIATGIPLIKHAQSGIIGWEECSEIILMAVLASLVVWHVRRAHAAQERLEATRAAEAVRAHNRELTSRFGSHELRTRLTIARSLMDLTMAHATSAQVRDDAGLAISEIDKALVTATNLLTLVRVDDPDDVIDVDLETLVYDVGRRWEINEDRLWRFEAEPMEIRAESERLEAAVDCLIENAVKFTDDFDAISVSARREGGVAVISVEDTGCGIPAADVGRVTELFETSSSAGERAGSGLGLGIVRAVAEAGGGSMAITSTEGVGTRVELRLPITPSARPAVTMPRPHIPARTDRARATAPRTELVEPV